MLQTRGKCSKPSPLSRSAPGLDGNTDALEATSRMTERHRTWGASTLTCCRSDVQTNWHSFSDIFVKVRSPVSLLECTIAQREAAGPNGPVGHPSQLGHTTQHPAPFPTPPPLQPTSPLVCCKALQPTQPPDTTQNRTSPTRCPGQRSHLKDARTARGQMGGRGAQMPSS